MNSSDTSLSSVNSQSPSNATLINIDFDKTDCDSNFSTDTGNMANNVFAKDPFDNLWTKIEKKLDSGVCKKLDEFIIKCESQFQLLHDRMDNYESRMLNLEDELIENAIDELELRSFRKNFVIFKNIPDKNNDKADIKYLQNILDMDKIHFQLDLGNITAYRLGKFDKN